MSLPTIIMSAVRVPSTEPHSHSSQRGRRNAMGDVTIGISADQLYSLEEMVQTFMPDFFNPASVSSASFPRDERSHHQRRRNAVANVVEELSPDDLQHLEALVKTHQPNTLRHHSPGDDGNSSGDGEEMCSSPSATGPEAAYCGRRRNALANALADMDDETLRRIQSLHCSRNNSNSTRFWNIGNRRI